MSDCQFEEFNISIFHFHNKLYVINVLSQVVPITVANAAAAMVAVGQLCFVFQ